MDQYSDEEKRELEDSSEYLEENKSKNENFEKEERILINNISEYIETR